ncbi:hypothetical protein FRC10_010944, partial [Ceratobasidium sp. 414]
ASFIYAISQNNDELVSQCRDQVSGCEPERGTTNPEDVCRLFTKWGRAGVVISLVVILLIELYCCFIISRYVAQLSDEQSFRAFNRNAGRGSGYYPHEPLHAGTELLGKEAHHEYPYAQPQHSFGHKG